MALKNPGELFGTAKKVPVKPAENVGENVNNIKEEFNKVEEIRKQLNDVSNSLNNSLTEVVDKNLNFLSNEYSDQLDKFNSKINSLREEINSKVAGITCKVDGLEKNNQYLKSEIQVVEQRQQTINLSRIKKEVFEGVENILSGDVTDNIKRLEEKIEVVRESYQQTLNETRVISEGLLDEPPNTDNGDPLSDQNFVTLQQLNDHYKLFLNRIQQQLSTLGGGGAVNIKDMDDVDQSSARVNNKFLKYDSASAKWVGADASGGGGSGITTEFVSAQTLNVVGLSTHRNGINVAGLSYLDGDVSFVGANTNALWDKSKSDLVLYDSTRLTLGSSEDFQIWHGTNSHIKNSTGSLRIRGDEIMLKRADDSEKYLLATKNEDVKLFYNNNEKFATTNTGATVTGSVTATSFIGDGSGLTGITGSGSGVVIKDGGSTVGTAGTINFGDNLSVSAISVGVVTVTGQAGSASTQFVAAETLTVSGVTTHYQDVQFPGAAYNILWDQATSKIKFDDSAQCVFGSASGGDMKLFHASGNSTIRNETGQFRIAGNDIRLQTQNHSEDYITCTDGAEVKLFFNDNEKLATTNTGVTVTGTVAATAFTGDGSALTGISAGALDSRGTTSASTGSIAQTASANITIPTRGKLFSLLKVAIDAPAWVVLYVDSASRTSDASRTEGTDPAPGSGVLTEVSTTTSGASTFLMTPAVIGWNNDGTPATQVYAKVTNKRSNSGSNTITVTLTTVKLEA